MAFGLNSGAYVAEIFRSGIDLETTGGVIGFDEMKHLMQEDGVVCVGEVMNYRQIVKGTEMEINYHFPLFR